MCSLALERPDNVNTSRGQRMNKGAFAGHVPEWMELYKCRRCQVFVFSAIQKYAKLLLRVQAIPLGHLVTGSTISEAMDQVLPILINRGTVGQRSKQFPKKGKKAVRIAPPTLQRHYLIAYVYLRTQVFRQSL